MGRHTKATVDSSENPRRSIHAKERERIFLRDKGKCVDCGKVCAGGWKIWKPSVKHFELNGTHEIHHIIPVIKGGETTIDNLILLCKECHLERHNLDRGIE
jgi:5-methylcytosine-specific restriction endonuclease McrA